MKVSSRSQLIIPDQIDRGLSEGSIKNVNGARHIERISDVNVAFGWLCQHK